MKYFDRKLISFKKLSERKSKVNIAEDYIKLDSDYNINPHNYETIKKLAKEIKTARKNNRPVIMAFGAHSIKNGLSIVMTNLIKNNYITHLATNGAGIIHDWEFSFLGKSSEDVRANVTVGEFGIWEETCFYINLAILVGASEGLGYGESIGRFISDDGVYIKSEKEILDQAHKNIELAAPLLDLLQKIKQFDLKEGFLKVDHKYKNYSIQKNAYELGIPFTSHPMFGHDIIYTHPMSTGAAIGRTAETDFLSFVNSVSNIENGVYISLGSAIMSPMIFEKSLSMARNVAIQNKLSINDFSIYVVDLAKNNWDWTKGEPSDSEPEYYLRYMKTFSRMGGRINYSSENNVDFLLALNKELSLI